MTDNGVISILCVDDEPFVLEIFEDFFKREPGFSVKTCSNATDALELLNTQQFDTVIADFGLPDMDGINLLRETRAGGFSGLFIIITGKHRAHVAIDALNNGADYYVQKGGGIVNDMDALVDFIRGRVSEKFGQTVHCLRVRVCIVQLLKTIPIFFAVFSRREKFVL